MGAPWPDLTVCSASCCSGTAVRNQLGCFVTLARHRSAAGPENGHADGSQVAALHAQAKQAWLDAAAVEVRSS